jgi:2-dehydro-3-deoxyphosphogalactonate aldolase
MNLVECFHVAMQACPLVAILRGIQPGESQAVAGALAGIGWPLLEVPLNSPEPLESIRRMRAACPDALVGAGTVLSAQSVRDVHASGGQMIVAPNFDLEVAREAVGLGLVYLPGVMTPSEAFAALAAGATALKLFPAEMIPPAAVKAVRAVLPPKTLLMPVGGITPGGMRAYVDAGANGFGIGSALYKPGRGADAVREAALDFQAALRGTIRA